MKYNYGSRHFWSEGYYVSTVGLNKKTIANYIKNQELEDQLKDKRSIFSGSELIKFLSLTIFFVVIGLINLIIFYLVNNNLSNIKYDYILYDLKKKGAKITYENKSTGTISYSRNGSRNQISVYRGCNSHANSLY